MPTHNDHQKFNACNNVLLHAFSVHVHCTGSIACVTACSRWKNTYFSQDVTPAPTSNSARYSACIDTPRLCRRTHYTDAMKH